MKLKQEFEKATKTKQTPTTGHYEFYISNEPIFWTHNSEWKPDYKLFYEQYNSTFTKVTGTPVNFIDTFTISTVLDRDDYTMLKIRDTRTHENKIYYIQKTNKILKEGFEFIGVLDVWLTYGINFIEWAKTITQYPDYKNPMVLVNRFLSNRLWDEYKEKGKFLEDDEFFDYSNENYVTVGSYNNFMGGIINEYVNNESTEADIKNLRFSVRDADWKRDTSSPPFDTKIQAIAIDMDYNLTNTNFQVYVFQADGKESKYGNFIPGEYVCVVVDTKANKKTENDVIYVGQDVIQVLTLERYLNGPKNDKIYTYFIHDVNALKHATINNPNSPWANKLVGVFNVPFWKNIKNLYLWKLPKPGTNTTYYHFITFKIPQNEFIPLVKFDDRLIGAGNAGFVPTLFINIANNQERTDSNSYRGISDYSTTWVVKENPFRYEPGVYTQNGINGAEGIKTGSTGYTNQFAMSRILPYAIYNPDNPDGTRYFDKEFLNKYALGRIKYWNTYLMPGINYLQYRKNNRIYTLLPNVPIRNNPPKYVTDIIYRPSGLGNGGGLSFTGSNFIWVNSHNGKTQLAISNPSMNAYISGWVQHLQANQSNMNTGLQIAQQQSNLEKQQAELNKKYGLKNADLQMAQGAMNIIGGLGDVAKGAVKGVSGIGNIGKGIGGMGGGITSMIGASIMKEQINEQYGLDMIRANNIYSHKEMEVNAALEDKRRSSKGTNILSTTTEADIMNKLSDYYNLGEWLNVRQLFGFRRGTNDRIEYKWNTKDNPRTIQSSNTDFMTAKAPLDPEGIRHYNRLTWNVGVKGNFYTRLQNVFRDHDIRHYKFSSNDKYNQNNPFIYLNITIEPYIYRQWKPKATAEIITALEAMFTSGVRIWSRKPTYTNDDAFKLVDSDDMRNKVNYKKDDEISTPDLDNDDLIQTLPEIDDKEERTAKKKTKKAKK